MIANSIFHPQFGVENNFNTYWIQVFNYNKLDLESFYEALDLIYDSFDNGVISIPLGYDINNLNENELKLHSKISFLLDKISNKFMIVAPLIFNKNLFPSNKNYVIKIKDIKNKNDKVNINVKGTIWETEIKKCFAFYDCNRYIKDIGESYYTVYLSWWILNYFNNKENSIKNIFIKNKK